MATFMSPNRGSGSSTFVVEMQSPKDAINVSESRRSFEVTAALPSPTTATPVLQKWNHPRSNLLKVLATFFSFVVLGANDAAYGALIPYLEEYYNISYLTVSLLFISPLVGYVTSALLNNSVHVHYGQRGCAVLGPLTHMIAYIIIALHPPYPALVVVCILAGFGNGLADSAWNAWIGDMANANEVLGFLHAFYGLGALMSPLVSTTLITRAGWNWYEFYYIMIGMAAFELITCTAAFWKATGEAYRTEHPDVIPSSSSPSPSIQPQDIPESNYSSLRRRAGLKPSTPRQNGNRKKSRTAEAISNKITWECAVFLLVYVGIEVALGGWIVTFMLRVRKGSNFASGLVSTGFWAGVTVGRIILGFVTARLFKTEKHAIATYITACVGLELLFWLVPSFAVSAVAVSFIGFFLGPLFPAAVVAATKLLPKHLHVAGIGFAAAFGASGACIFPFAVGAIAQARGVQVLQPIILALLVMDLALWWVIPKLPKIRSA